MDKVCHDSAAPAAGAASAEAGLPTTTLDLIVPWELPLALASTPAERDALTRALAALECALDLDAPAAAAELDRIMASLEAPATVTARPRETLTSLSVEEVDEYDRYFHIRHVHTPANAQSLLLGLLHTCRMFMLLCARVPQLDRAQVATQKQGYLSYVRLLGRMLDPRKPA